MKILIACEESQVVAAAFRSKGHEAYSCDLLDCSGNHPEWHLKQDVLQLLDQHWDMIIAFPPCTYMSKAGARWLYQNGQLNYDRLNKAKAAKEFFMLFYNNSCKKICIENPVPLNIVGLPKPSQDIQPYYFGHQYSKKTYLWLKGIPPLMATNIIIDHKPYLPSNTGYGKRNGLKWSKGFAHNSIIASKTFTGVAAAMADQWG
jgi:hypothetical protein